MTEWGARMNYHQGIEHDVRCRIVKQYILWFQIGVSQLIIVQN